MSIGTRLFFWWVPASSPVPPDPPPTQPPPSEVDDAVEGFGDDCIGEQVMALVPVGGPRADELTGADHWLFFNGVRSRGVKLASVSANRDIGQRGTLRFTMLKTPDVAFDVPALGSLVQLSWHDHLQWAGMVENSRLINREGTHDTVMEIQIDCASWERIAERHMTQSTYSNKTSRAIFLDVLANVLADEGIVEGVIDEGLSLTLVGPRQSGDYIRISELLRDVAESSGGLYDIDPFKRLNFRKDNVGNGSLVLGNLTTLHQAESAIERQDYRNVQIVRAKGTGTSELTYTRELAAEISARRAIEGGTGRYVSFEEINHPFSDDPADVGRLAVSQAVVKLNALGQHARTTRGTLKFPRYRLGDVVVANYPEHGVEGTWQLAGVRYRAIHDRLFADYELVQTSALQRKFNGWLKITGAGRALVQIPGTPVFSNTATITASQTWIVPDANGDGTPVEVSFDLFGAGGGGTHAYPSANNNGQSPYFYSACGNPFVFTGYPAFGVAGSAGERATSLRKLPVGTAITIVLGAGGSGSVFSCASFFDNPNPGNPGGVSTISQGATILAKANGGGGGYSGAGPGTGGIGDFLTPGGGTPGGGGGNIPDGAGSAGHAAYVEIRY